ncbi:MAG: cohesin domain-containing protein [Actinobacteria bacterium]|nr:cohesin domain-containing protein [Actinomycetota bacterium]
MQYFGFPPTPRTATFAFPSKSQYKIGEIFNMEIKVSGMKKPINVVQVDLGFDPHKVEIVDISTKKSFANIFIQKEIDNNKGFARLTGGLPNPGFFGSEDVFSTVLLKGKSPGLAAIRFLPSSMVLANDGQGTNILKDFGTAYYLILPEKLSEKEQDQQLVLKADVLGASTIKEDKQLLLFSEGEKILGAETKKEIKKGASPIGFLFGVLEKTDNSIILLWKLLIPDL